MASLAPDLDEDEDEDDEPEHNVHLAFNQPSVSASEDDGGSPVRRRRRDGGMVRFLILAPLVTLAISTTLFLIWLAIRYVLANPELINENAYVSRIENAYFPVLLKPWADFKADVERARNARGAMAINYVACRSNPNSAVGLYHRDYQTRLPGEGEMVDIALTKLRGDPYTSARGYFTGVEWEQRDGEFTLAGKPAIRLNFEGVDGENVVTSGEVWCMAANGVGYWLFFWAPKHEMTEEISQEWEEIRKRFQLGEKRNGWVETVIDPQLKRIPETNYEFKYPGAGLWELREEDGWDPAASVVLISYERDNKNRPPVPNKRYAGKMAVLQVLKLAPVASPEAALQSAKDHLLAQQKEENPETRMVVLDDKEGKPREGTVQIGTAEGLSTHLEIIPEAGGRKRYFLLAVIPDPQNLLVFQFGCPYDRALYWETEFVSILKTVRNFKNPQ
jgi:hypothetical protein